MSLAKRKERDEGSPSSAKPHGSTIFVSNLPYSATTTDLNTLFSDLGPVRSAFVVLDHSNGSSKGVGYVSFSIKEDAQLAFDKANQSSEGLVLDGRRLRAQWADSKPHKEKNKSRSTTEVENASDAKPARKSRQPSHPSDPLAIRTIVVSGLPAAIDPKTLWKKVRKYGGAEKIEWPSKKDGVEDPNTALVIFSTPAAAQEAVNKLHAHVFKGSLISVTLKRRLDGLAKPKPMKFKKASQADVETPRLGEGGFVVAPSRANRLIVRNLPWGITEQDLRSVFLPYGPIYSIHIPTKEPEVTDEAQQASSPQLRIKGYAFVWMLSKKDAERAVEGANGAKVKAGMAEGLVKDKQKKKKLKREEAKLEKERRERVAQQKGKGVADTGANDEDQAEREGANDGAVESSNTTLERIIAVDWALSKDKWEEAKVKMQDDGDGEAESEGSGSNSENNESQSDDDDGSSHIGIHHGDSDSGSSADEDGMNLDEEDVKPGRPQLPPPEIGTTLFVRNVPYEATEDEIRTLFRAFGPLRYARVTIDHETGRSRGTGFVCFWNKADADKAIEQSDILKRETTGADSEHAPPAKKNPFKLPSLLTPDPSASVAQNLVLHGRTMDVIRAVTRDEAGKLKEEGERQREKADKRNLYLLREGIILPNTPAAASLSSAEIERRTVSSNARRTMLKSNPSLYVSRTRLSIRQIPLFVTERMLKRLAIHSIRTFEAEVKSGNRNGLTADETVEIAQDEEDENAKTKFNGQKAKGGRSTGVKQAKIVRQADRVDQVTGKGRSKGYGFLELEKHADALRVLRWSNNNSAAGRLFSQWWKEELEDLISIEKKKEKKDDARLEKLKNELEQGSQKKEKGALIVEFSIENIQVVKRRSAHQEEQRSKPSQDNKSRKGDHSSSKSRMKQESHGDESHERPHKMRRTSDPASPMQQLKAEAQEPKSERNVGAIIGRKRRDRKGKKSG